MDTVIHLNVESLNDAFIRDLKEQFGSAEIELRVHKKPQLWMTQEQFWELIDLLDWSKTGDNAAVAAPLVEALAAMPVGSIHQFEDILSEKLWRLDTRAHAQASKSDDPNGYLSADGFLYDRCCVVANGRAFYESVLNEPAKFPAGCSFSALLSVASEAYSQKTGQTFLHISKFDYETGGNLASWAEAIS
ncbi:MAG: DUF4240 domain-containing protein [Saprospiraceae bacterium]